MEHLIRCRKCDEIFMKTPFDQYPDYQWEPNRSPETFRSIERDDLQDFLIHHHGHQLEHLEIIEDSFISEKVYFEPVKTSFIKATNGKDKFVIKKYREHIDEPLKYLLIPGDYSLKCINIEIQSEEISRQLKRELKPHLSQAQIEAFLKLYHHIVQDIDIKDLERIPEESPHPLEVFHKLDDLHLVYLLRNCHNIFKDQEYSAMEDFVYRHKDDGVLLLKATFQIQITQMANPEKKGNPTSMALEREKVIIKK